MSAEVHLRLAAAACSRRAGALTTLPSLSLTAYASAGNVVILDNLSSIVQAVLPTHSSPVTAVALQAASNFVILLAAASDGRVSTWTSLCGAPSDWKLASRWIAHDRQPCVALAAAQLSSTVVCVTAGMEGRIVLWGLPEGCDDWERVAGVDVGESDGVLLECVALRATSAQSAVIAVGGTDSRVWLFSMSLGERAHLRLAGVLRGHRDWIRGVAFSSAGAERAPFYMATASKDTTARVWLVCRDSIDDKDDDFDSHTARVAANLGDEQWTFAAVALLDEHTAAVHSVAFEAKPSGSVPRLLTSSMDCSVALWSCGSGGFWVCSARFGLMGGASAHALGFFGAAFATSKGDEVLGHNFAGALHSWHTQTSNNSLQGGVSNEFLAKPAPGGHFAPVTDLAWEPKGRYLLTCSADKTARIFAEVEEQGRSRFVEWARPQVHGHAISAVAFCDEEGRRYVSGAEERMLRVLDAPLSYTLPGDSACGGLDSQNDNIAMSAVVPELGLSNKATFQIDDDAKTSQLSSDSKVGENNFVEVTSFGASRAASAIPLEEDLKGKRLWPETAKLYGHGNEISCVTAHPPLNMLASACRAQSAKDADIILWDSKSGMERRRLSCHDLTVNQMRFSVDGKLLVSVSRDRSFAIHRRSSDDDCFGFSLQHRCESAHTRLIYSCAWLLHNKFVATGGRDKAFKIFRLPKSIGETRVDEVLKKKFESSVTAIDSASFPDGSGRSMIALGFESGHVRLLCATHDSELSVTVAVLFSTTENSRCSARVNSLRWRPLAFTVSDEVANLQLATAGDDLCVRILDFELDPNTKAPMLEKEPTLLSNLTSH